MMYLLKVSVLLHWIEKFSRKCSKSKVLIKVFKMPINTNYLQFYALLLGAHRIVGKQNDGGCIFEFIEYIFFFCHRTLRNQLSPILKKKQFYQ